ncbi:Hypothetical_protein [Hexamita inflata]|uniref:Hypothetical_protein n=1 Tax=Hexamita inflata TaxID=28002 RepID=A0ABP1GF69_9EUKA
MNIIPQLRHNMLMQQNQQLAYNETEKIMRQSGQLDQILNNCLQQLKAYVLANHFSLQFQYYFNENIDIDDDVDTVEVDLKSCLNRILGNVNENDFYITMCCDRLCISKILIDVLNKLMADCQNAQDQILDMVDTIILILMKLTSYSMLNCFQLVNCDVRQVIEQIVQKPYLQTSNIHSRLNILCSHLLSTDIRFLGQLDPSVINYFLSKTTEASAFLYQHLLRANYIDSSVFDFFIRSVQSQNDKIQQSVVQIFGQPELLCDQHVYELITMFPDVISKCKSTYFSLFVKYLLESNKLTVEIVQAYTATNQPLTQLLAQQPEFQKIILQQFKLKINEKSQKETDQTINLLLTLEDELMNPVNDEMRTKMSGKLEKFVKKYLEVFQLSQTCFDLLLMIAEQFQSVNLKQFERDIKQCDFEGRESLLEIINVL